MWSFHLFNSTSKLQSVLKNHCLFHFLNTSVIHKFVLKILFLYVSHNIFVLIVFNTCTYYCLFSQTQCTESGIVWYCVGIISSNLGVLYSNRVNVSIMSCNLLILLITGRVVQINNAYVTMEL